MYILDSNVISELRQGKANPNPNARAWANELYLSAIGVLELDMGARQMERKDTAQGSILRTWVERCSASLRCGFWRFPAQRL